MHFTLLVACLTLEIEVLVFWFSKENSSLCSPLLQRVRKRELGVPVLPGVFPQDPASQESVAPPPLCALN